MRQPATPPVQRAIPQPVRRSKTPPVQRAVTPPVRRSKTPSIYCEHCCNHKLPLKNKGQYSICFIIVIVSFIITVIVILSKIEVLKFK